MEPVVSIGSQPDRALMALKDLPGPPGIPIFGNARQIIPHQMHIQLEDWCHVFGERYRISLGARKILVCSNAEDIAAVLKNRPKHFRRTTRLEMISKELNMAGLFAANGDDWRRQRTLVMHAFNPVHVKSYYPSLQIVTRRLLGRFRTLADKKTPFELIPELMRYTVDVTAGLAFGTDVNTIETDGVTIQQHLNGTFRMLQKRLFAPFPYWHWIKFSDDRALDRSAQVIKNAIQGFIQSARERMSENPRLFDFPENLLEALIAARDENESKLSEADLTGNILTILLAGEDTTAHTLAWTIYYFYKYPKVFSRAREEVDSVIGEDDVASNYERLAEMDFLEACINESMRLRPVAPFIGSEANFDTQVADVSIPKGTMILMLPRVASIDERNFLKAMEFRPERWLEAGRHEHNRKVSIPFGSGPRLCPGRFLAMEEMKMALSTLIKNFDIELIESQNGNQVREHLSFTMSPLGLHMKMRKRDFSIRHIL